MISMVFTLPRVDVSPALAGTFFLYAGLVGVTLALVLLLVLRYRRQALHWTLGSQLLLTVTGVALMSLALIVAIFIWQTRAILTTQTGEAYLALAESESQRLRVELSKEVEALQNLASGERYYTWLVNTSETDLVGLSYEERTAHLQAVDRAWVDKSDQVLHASVLFNSVSNELGSFVRDFPGHTQLLLTDRYGRLMATGGSPPAHYYYGDQVWWREAWHEGEGAVYLGRPRVTPGASGAMLDIAVPIKFGFSVRGVLYSQLALRELGIFSAAPSRITSLGETSELNLVDDAGTLLYSSNPARTQLAAEIWGDAAGTSLGWGVASDESEQRFIYSHAALIPAPEQPYLAALGWSILVQQAEAEALASVGRLTHVAVISGLVALGLAIAVGSWSARRLIRPIKDLTSTASAMAGGQLGLSAKVAGPTELGTLARSFNSMTSQLRALIEGLEQRVADRTRDLERRSAQLQAAAEVGHAAASIRSLDELLPQVTHLINERFGFYHAGIFLLDEAGEYAVLRAASSEGGQHMLARGHRLKVGEQGIVGYVTRTGEPRIALDVGADKAHFQNPDLPDTRSEIALPLIAGGHILGALDVQSTEETAFTEEDKAALQVLADQIAVALDNARLFAESQAALEAERRAYGELSYRAWIDLLRAHPSLSYRYEQGIVAPLGDDGQHRPLNSAAPQDADSGLDETLPELTLPVQVRGHRVGSISAHKPGKAGEWSADEIVLMESLAEQLSLALESARLYQDTQRRAARERLVGEVTARVRETLEMESVLKTAVQEIRQSLGLPEVVVRLAPQPVSQAGNGHGQSEA